MNENDKGWGNPAFVKIYLALAFADERQQKHASKFQQNSIMNWLNHNGFCNLTVCPECHVDDFTHVETCRAGKVIARGRVD